MGLSESKLRALYKKGDNQTLTDFYLFFSIVAEQQPIDLSKVKVVSKEKKIEKLEMTYDSFKRFFDVPYDEITKSFFRVFDDKNTQKTTFFTFASKMLAYPTLNDHEKTQLAYHLINTENRNELNYEDFNLLVNATYEKNITISELIQELQVILFPSTTMPLSFEDFEKYSTKPKNYIDVIIEGYFYLFPAFCLPWFVKQKKNIPMLNEALKKEREQRLNIEMKKKEEENKKLEGDEDDDPLERKLKEIEERKKKKVVEKEEEAPSYEFDIKKDPLFEKDNKEWFDSDEDEQQEGENEEERKKKVNIVINLKEIKPEEKKKVKAISFAFGAKPKTKDEKKQEKKEENEEEEIKKALKLMENNKIDDAEIILKKCAQMELNNNLIKLVKAYFLMCEIIEYNETKENEEGVLLNCFLMILPVLKPHRRLAIALAIEYLKKMNSCISSVNNFLQFFGEKGLQIKQIVNKCWKCGKDKIDLNSCSCGETLNIVFNKRGIQIGGNNVWKCDKCGLLNEGDHCVLCNNENKEIKSSINGTSSFDSFEDFGFNTSKNEEVKFDNFFGSDIPKFDDFSFGESNPIEKKKDEISVIESPNHKEEKKTDISYEIDNNQNNSIKEEQKQDFSFDDFFSKSTDSNTFDSTSFNNDFSFNKSFEEPNKEEPNKEEPNKEEPNKEELNKEELNKEELNKEELIKPEEDKSESIKPENIKSETDQFELKEKKEECNTQQETKQDFKFEDFFSNTNNNETTFDSINEPTSPFKNSFLDDQTEVVQEPKQEEIKTVIENVKEDVKKEDDKTQTNLTEDNAFVIEDEEYVYQRPSH
ncbi:DNA double-strand break repair Rad50 ATPase, putative [Entamoeba dispar SAW760]|uniref:DNA double-strand break repair Rad50 ATPase, putative n=1 Tax=Entamoeba dispar (strain ATCC PRA-260 / SAW760) TaxID=370354 RepID=B0EMP2_ENTDS|nr:DNA double-strand break repair Rad50 ATPase, putative [Entamoeba dispar SAW760]EDR24207.1 DNA double-strand break repair Rad50 ATPase, putative [Entamoeba dispar SAW760]|eukprot:EDR24207.1 DNA double-strand break repair Rad50 ATPase, putative [Entamoeba dispar SAW760]